MPNNHSRQCTDNHAPALLSHSKENRQKRNRELEGEEVAAAKNLPVAQQPPGVVL